MGTAALYVDGCPRTPKPDLIVDGFRAITPEGWPGQMPTPAAPRPRESRIWVKRPPKEWPIMIGGVGRASMMEA